MGCMFTNGGVRPLAGVMNCPDVGPSAKLSAGSTAMPSSDWPFRGIIKAAASIETITTTTRF